MLVLIRNGEAYMYTGCFDLKNRRPVEVEQLQEK
jgi:hypothetical protein